MSPSIRRVRRPACALVCANASLTVDFPSFGSADVMPTTVLGEPKLLRSAANLIDRNASAKRENGESITNRATVFLTGSNCSRRDFGNWVTSGSILRAAAELGPLSSDFTPTGELALPANGHLLLISRKYRFVPEPAPPSSTTGIEARQLV